MDTMIVIGGARYGAKRSTLPASRASRLRAARAFEGEFSGVRGSVGRGTAATPAPNFDPTLDATSFRIT